MMHIHNDLHYLITMMLYMDHYVLATIGHFTFDNFKN